MVRRNSSYRRISPPMGLGNSDRNGYREDVVSRNLLTLFAWPKLDEKHYYFIKNRYKYSTLMCKTLKTSRYFLGMDQISEERKRNCFIRSI